MSDRQPLAASWPHFTPSRFALLLALLLVLAFPEVLLGRQSFFYRDYGVLAYPTIHYYRECFWRGEAPLWNPLSNCGTPFLAQWGTMVLYPGALFYLLLPLPWSLGFFCLAHLFLGGLGMYWLGYRWTNNRLAATLAGVAFAFNGVALSCLLWPNYLVALGWMPWVVLLGQRAGVEGGGRRAVLAAAAGALQMLAGVPEIVLLTWLILVSSGLAAGNGATASRLRVGARLVGVAALVAGLTAAQTLPFLDLLAHSQRGSGFATTKWSLPVWGGANLFMPLFHCFQTTQGLFFQYNQEFFSSTYLGAGMLALAVWVGVCHRRGPVLLLLVLALLGLALALGEEGPVYRWFRWAFPFSGVARYPVKFLLLTSFATPLLAAYAISCCADQRPDDWARARRQRAVAGLFILLLMSGLLWIAYHHPLPKDQWPATLRNTAVRAGLLLVTLGLVWRLQADHRPTGRWVAGLGLILATWLDFQTHVPRQNPSIPSASLSATLPRSPALPGLGEGRVLISPRAEDLLLRSRVADFEQDFLGKRLALWSNLNLVEGVPKVNGSATLQLREQAQVQSLLYATLETDLPRLADFLGATQTSSPSNAVEWIARPSASPLITAGQRPVFVAGDTPPPELLQPDFDGQRVVFLPRELRGLVSVTNAAPAKVTAVQFGRGRVEFEVEADAPAWVVVAQSYYHRWQAAVNGKPVPLRRANHAFQALEAPGGRSRVTLVYWDPALILGLMVSGLAVLTSLALLRGGRGALAGSAGDADGAPRSA